MLIAASLWHELGVVQLFEVIQRKRQSVETVQFVIGVSLGSMNWS